MNKPINSIWIYFYNSKSKDTYIKIDSLNVNSNKRGGEKKTMKENINKFSSWKFKNNYIFFVHRPGAPFKPDYSIYNI